MVILGSVLGFVGSILSGKNNNSSRFSITHPPAHPFHRVCYQVAFAARLFSDFSSCWGVAAGHHPGTSPRSKALVFTKLERAWLQPPTHQPLIIFLGKFPVWGHAKESWGKGGKSKAGDLNSNGMNQNGNDFSQTCFFTQNCVPTNHHVSVSHALAPILSSTRFTKSPSQRVCSLNRALELTELTA